MPASMTATDLTSGAAYTAIVVVYAETGAPAVRARVGSAVSATSSVTGSVVELRVTFTAASASATIELEPVGTDIHGGAVYLLGMGAVAGAGYAGAYFTGEQRAASPVTVLDHEAQQGAQTDYIVADENGAQLAATRITVPAWGTWLKSPSRPYRNARCYFEHEGAVKRVASRLVIDVEGGGPVVLSSPRGGKRGDVRLLALAGADADAIDRLLDDGDTLLLDTHPSWGVPYRYVSVGDSTSTRPYFDGTLGLDRPVRSFTLGDVVDVAMPIGVTAVDPTWIVAAVPTKFGSYAALAATVPTYEALATGEF